MKKIKKSNTPTAHNAAKKGQIAPRVIVCGDPKRAKFIATNFIKNPKLVSDVRGICCYTGTYKNKPVSVMAHGMGIPSICIYAHELYAFYGVKTIYRVGSAGSMSKDIKVGDVIVAKAAWNDSLDFKKWMDINEDKKNFFYPTKKSLDLIIKTAKTLKTKINVCDICSEDFFYTTMPIKKRLEISNNIKICEMESYGLFALAKKFKANAAALLTISDNILSLEGMSAKERETKFTNMMKLALEAIIKQ